MHKQYLFKECQEEEKLARDVCLTLYDKMGVKGIYEYRRIRKYTYGYNGNSA